jgi:hypothetical protein
MSTDRYSINPGASKVSRTRDGRTGDVGELPTLDALVLRRLRIVANRLRRYILVEGLAWVLGFMLAASLVQVGLDLGARGLRWSMRAALLALVLAGTGWLAWRRIVRPLRKRIGLAEVANLVERKYPQLGSILISGLRFSTGEVGFPETNSPGMMAAVISRAGREGKAVDFNVVLDPRRVRWSWAGIAAVVLVGMGLTLTLPEITALWFARSVLLQEVALPKRTHLVVNLEGDELIAARGDDVVIEASANGVQPREVEIVFETVSGKRGREAMVTVGASGSYRYRYTAKNAQEDFAFHLEGGDDQTGSYRVRLLDRPRVQHSEMRIVPPAYTRMDPYTLGDERRSAQVLPGSGVTVSIEANKPVALATLIAGEDAAAEAACEDQRCTVSIRPVETETYHFALVDKVGLENRRPARFSIRVIRDEPPHVRMKLSGVGDMITPEAVLPIEAEYGDTYGLATAELVYQVLREDAPERSISLPDFRPHTRTFKASVSWPVSSEALVPGDRLALMARATDFDDVSGPNFAQSPDLTLRIVTRDELLAELARREQAHRVDFERLVDAQEQLRGRLLTVLGQHRGPTALPDLASAAGPLERRQRNLVGSVNVIRQQFEQILSELRVNQLGTKDEVRRLRQGIIDPLTQLAKRDLITAADMIRRWARDGSPERASLIDPQQVAVISQMRAVLENMIQWEGYHEIVNMLRDIIRLQRELNEEAEQTLLDSAGDIFED